MAERSTWCRSRANWRGMDTKCTWPISNPAPAVQLPSGAAAHPMPRDASIPVVDAWIADPGFVVPGPTRRGDGAVLQLRRRGVVARDRGRDSHGAGSEFADDRIPRFVEIANRCFAAWRIPEAPRTNRQIGIADHHSVERDRAAAVPGKNTRNRMGRRHGRIRPGAASG